MLDADFVEAVWCDMGSLYQVPGISECCLALQDERDADIPLLLLLFLLDQAGITCRPDGFQAFLDTAAAWREQVIRPLRIVRRNMKACCVSEAERSLRDAVKKIELQAEKQHVARLVESFPATEGGMTRMAERYLAGRGAWPEEQRACLTAFAAARALNSDQRHQSRRTGMQ